jgi:putative transposase
VSRYRFIVAEKEHHPVARLCRVLRVSTSGFYAWWGRPPSARAVADAALTATIRAIHAGSRGTYGAPRVHAELADAHGVRCGRKRVARLMRAAGLAGVCRRRSVRTTRRDEAAAVSDDLVKRAFAAPAPNRLWVADITYLPTWQGFLYLAVVLDACSRRVVGWSMADHLRAELVVDALDMALWSRRPAAGLVHHSDHGAQYTGLAFGRRCREAGIAVSMGSVGDCFDNALAESFFATLECELVVRSRWRTRDEARMAVFDFIEAFYNPRRRHSALAYLSPAEYEWRHHPERSCLSHELSARAG